MVPRYAIAFLEEILYRLEEMINVYDANKSHKNLQKQFAKEYFISFQKN